MTLSGVPRLPRGLIARPRLDALLEDSAQLVVLHAPSGYGKSVALARWAASTTRSGLWMRVSPGMESSAAFVEAVATALVTRGVVDAEHSFARAADALTFVSDAWAYLAAGLSSLPEPVTLAIDEAHVLDDDAARGLLTFLHDAPDVSIRLATRRSSPLTETSAGLDLDVVHVDAAALGLTRSEASDILGARSEPARLNELAAGGGAPALARLMVLGAERDRASVWSVPEAADSLLRMRRSDWDDEFVEFLERAALPDSLELSFAIRLTGRDDAAALLDRAEAEGVGAWAQTPSGSSRVFLFASFLREALERDLRRRVPSAEMRTLELEVAEWDRENGRPLPALARAVRYAEWVLASDIVREHWGDLLKSGAQVRQLFAGVSALSLTRYPLITVLLAIVYNARQASRLRAVEYFLLAAYGARMQRSSATPADRALLGTIETAGMRVAGRSRSAGASARATYDLLVGVDIRERDRLGSNEPTVWNQVGTSLFYAGDTEAALDSFRRSTAVSDAKGLTAGLQGLALTAGTLAVSGDMPEARAAVLDAETRHWPDGWIDGYAGSLYQLARGFLALEDGDVDGADAHARVIDPHRPTIEHWPLFAHLDALVSLFRHDPEGARLRVEAESTHQRTRHQSLRLTEARIRHTLVLIELARGEVTTAENLLAKAPSDARTAVSKARLHLARADPDRAMRELRLLDPRSASARVRAEALALSTSALALTGDGPATAASVRRLDALLRERGQSIALALVPAAALEALQRAAGSSGVPALDVAVARARSAAVLSGVTAPPRLTPRERAVARELLRSDSVAAIADALSVSPNTVKTQLRTLYRKLDVGSRSEALRALETRGVMGEGET